MANFNLYVVTGCVLLVALLSWRTSDAGLVPPHRYLRSTEPGPLSLGCNSSRLLELSRKLLRRISELLKDDKYEGVECKVFDDRMVRSQTVQTCAPKIPQNSACTSQRNSLFNESECLGDIMKDLSYYHSAIKNYTEAQSAHPAYTLPNDATLRDTMETIKNLKNCCQAPDEGIYSSQAWSLVWAKGIATATFDNKVQMCKVMKAFRSRAITISRAMGYISSGDHKPPEE